MSNPSFDTIVKNQSFSEEFIRETFEAHPLKDLGASLIFIRATINNVQHGPRAFFFNYGEFTLNEEIQHRRHHYIERLERKFRLHTDDIRLRVKFFIAEAIKDLFATPEYDTERRLLFLSCIKGFTHSCIEDGLTLVGIHESGMLLIDLQIDNLYKTDATFSQYQVTNYILSSGVWYDHLSVQQIMKKPFITIPEKDESTYEQSIYNVLSWCRPLSLGIHFALKMLTKSSDVICIFIFNEEASVYSTLLSRLPEGLESLFTLIPENPAEQVPILSVLKEAVRCGISGPDEYAQTLQAFALLLRSVSFEHDAQGDSNCFFVQVGERNVELTNFKVVDQILN